MPSPDDWAPIEIISQRGDAVLMSIDDYWALEETAYLLGAPTNARRLLESVDQPHRQHRGTWLNRFASGRTMIGHKGEVTAVVKRVRSERLEVRTTPEDRALIDRAVAASGTDLTDFVVTNLTVASRRVLADRTDFALGPEGRQAWERINRRRARRLDGLRELLERPSPFTDE